MSNRRILISGAGIAGLTLGWWLKKYGFSPTIVEKSPVPREGGYMIDFWGTGFDIAEKMQILPELKKAHYDIPEIEFVNEKGKKVGGFSVQKLRALMQFRHFNFLRGSLAQILYNNVKNELEILFDDSIERIQSDTTELIVDFRKGRRRPFDLVVGADGLHSAVRDLIFGAESQFEKFLGYYNASFTIDNGIQNDRAFRSYSTPGKQTAIYSLRDNILAAYFVFKSREKFDLQHATEEETKTILRRVFLNEGWECPLLLSKIDSVSDFFFDSVSQIRLSRWSKGGVTLVGDACQCVSPIAGEGAGLAMTGAYILAGEIMNARGDFRSALWRYEQIMKPEIERKQKSAQDMAASFVPNTKCGIWVRNTFTSFMFLPFVSKWLIKQYLSDSLSLQEYE